MVRTNSEVSSKKRRANRRNAKKSTGPRTRQGKARAALNSTTHGIFCSRLVLAGEDEVDLVVIREGYLKKLSPQDVVELALVDQIINAQWRLMRCQRAEAEHLEQIQFQSRNIARKKFARFLHDYDISDDLDAEEAKDEDKDPITKARYARMRAYQQADFVEMPAESLLCQAFMLPGRDCAIERMSRYEQRLNNTITRCMSELEKSRGTKRSEWKDLPPSPFLASTNKTDAPWPPNVIDKEEMEHLSDELNETRKRIQTLEEALEAESAALMQSDEDDQEGDEDGDDDNDDEHLDKPIVQNEPTASESVPTPGPAETSVGSAVRTSPTTDIATEEVRTADPTPEPNADRAVTQDRPKRPNFRAY